MEEESSKNMQYSANQKLDPVQSPENKRHKTELQSGKNQTKVEDTAALEKQFKNTLHIVNSDEDSHGQTEEDHNRYAQLHSNIEDEMINLINSDKGSPVNIEEDDLDVSSQNQMPLVINQNMRIEQQNSSSGEYEIGSGPQLRQSKFIHRNSFEFENNNQTKNPNLDSNSSQNQQIFTSNDQDIKHQPQGQNQTSPILLQENFNLQYNSTGSADYKGANKQAFFQGNFPVQTTPDRIQNNTQSSFQMPHPTYPMNQVGDPTAMRYNSNPFKQSNQADRISTPQQDIFMATTQFSNELKSASHPMDLADPSNKVPKGSFHESQNNLFLNSSEGSVGGLVHAKEPISTHILGAQAKLQKQFSQSQQIQFSHQLGGSLSGNSHQQDLNQIFQQNSQDNQTENQRQSQSSQMLQLQQEQQYQQNQLGSNPHNGALYPQSLVQQKQFSFQPQPLQHDYTTSSSQDDGRTSGPVQLQVKQSPNYTSSFVSEDTGTPTLMFQQYGTANQNLQFQPQLSGSQGAISARVSQTSPIQYFLPGQNAGDFSNQPQMLTQQQSMHSSMMNFNSYLKPMQQTSAQFIHISDESDNNMQRAKFANSMIEMNQLPSSLDASKQMLHISDLDAEGQQNYASNQQMVQQESHMNAQGNYGHSTYGQGRGISQSQKNKVNFYSILDRTEIRTCLMIKNIPNKFTQDELYSIIKLDTDYSEMYNFFYLPMDLNQKDIKQYSNNGYAFINFIHSLYILQFFLEFQGFEWAKHVPKCNSGKVLDLVFGEQQGFEACSQQFRNKKITSINIEGVAPQFKEHMPQPSQQQLNQIVQFYQSKDQNGQLREFISKKEIKIQQLKLVQKQQQLLQLQHQTQQQHPANSSSVGHQSMVHQSHPMPTSYYLQNSQSQQFYPAQKQQQMSLQQNSISDQNKLEQIQKPVQKELVIEHAHQIKSKESEQVISKDKAQSSDVKEPKKFGTLSIDGHSKEDKAIQGNNDSDACETQRRQPVKQYSDKKQPYKQSSVSSSLQYSNEKKNQNVYSSKQNYSSNKRHLETYRRGSMQQSYTNSTHKHYEDDYYYYSNQSQQDETSSYQGAPKRRVQKYPPVNNQQSQDGSRSHRQYQNYTQGQGYHDERHYQNQGYAQSSRKQGYGQANQYHQYPQKQVTARHYYNQGDRYYQEQSNFQGNNQQSYGKNYQAGQNSGSKKGKHYEIQRLPPYNKGQGSQQNQSFQGSKDQENTFSSHRTLQYSKPQASSGGYTQRGPQQHHNNNYHQSKNAYFNVDERQYQSNSNAHHTSNKTNFGSQSSQYQAKSGANTSNVQQKYQKKQAGANTQSGVNSSQGQQFYQQKQGAKNTYQ